MQTDNILTPKERLMIAAQVANAEARYVDSDTVNGQRLIAETSLGIADELIRQSGCIVSGAELVGHEMD